MSKVIILFTTTDKLLSRWIRFLTGEPVSHCAVQAGKYVVESSLTGIRIRTLEDFSKHSRIVHRAEVPVNPEDVLYRYVTKQYKRYDYAGLLYLGLRYLSKRYLMIQLPKANLWATSGMYTCTEWVTDVIDGREDSLITPEQLYLRLEARK